MKLMVDVLHLDPGHRMIAVVEAPSIEVVAKLVNDIGMSQWNTAEVCPAKPSADWIADIDKFPILYD